MPLQVLSGHCNWMRQLMRWPPGSVSDNITKKHFSKAPIIGRMFFFAEDFLRDELLFTRFVLHSNPIHFFIHRIEVRLHQKNCT